MAGLSAESGEVLAELTPDEVFAKRLHGEELSDDDISVLQGLHAQVLASLQEAEQ